MIKYKTFTASELNLRYENPLKFAIQYGRPELQMIRVVCIEGRLCKNDEVPGRLDEGQIDNVFLSRVHLDCGEMAAVLRVHFENLTKNREK